MDKVTHAAAMVLNLEVPFPIGYTLIKGKLNGETISEALENEQNYFSSHKIYSSLPSNYLGTLSLRAKLASFIVYRIKMSPIWVRNYLNNPFSPFVNGNQARPLLYTGNLFG